MNTKVYGGDFGAAEERENSEMKNLGKRKYIQIDHLAFISSGKKKNEVAQENGHMVVVQRNTLAEPFASSSDDFGYPKKICQITICNYLHRCNCNSKLTPFFSYAQQDKKS